MGDTLNFEKNSQGENKFLMHIINTKKDVVYDDQFNNIIKGDLDN